MNVELPKNVVEYYNKTKKNLEKLIALQELDGEKYIEKKMEMDELDEKFREQQETINSIAKEAQETSGMSDEEVESLFKRFTDGEITEKEVLNQVMQSQQETSNSGDMYR